MIKSYNGVGTHLLLMTDCMLCPTHTIYIFINIGLTHTHNIFINRTEKNTHTHVYYFKISTISKILCKLNVLIWHF